MSFITDNTTIIMPGLLGLVVVMLVVIAVLLVRRRIASHEPISVIISPDEAAVARMRGAMEHHADVSAVVALIKGLEADPDSVALLEQYPATVRAAAWLHYVNKLGADLQYAQSVLSNVHQRRYERADYHYAEHEQVVAREQRNVDMLRTKLDKAIEASGHGKLRAL